MIHYQPRTLTVGVVQMYNELHLGRNRDKIIKLLIEAAKKGARFVVFPESALSFSNKHPASEEELKEAQIKIHEAAGAMGVYALYCVQYIAIENGGRCNDAILVDPEGRVIFKQSKIYDKKGNRPGIFYIDGIPCNVAICADRWLRQACDLPVVKESRIFIECSWSAPPDYGRNGKISDLKNSFWRPKVWRLNCYFIRTNCANIMEPDGQIHSGNGEPDNILVRTLELSKATRMEAMKRRTHPAFSAWWEKGIQMLEGLDYSAPEFKSLLSAQTAIKASAVQMRCSRRIEENLKTILYSIHFAAAAGADLVVFPELSLTGGLTEDILACNNEVLSTSIQQIADATRQNRICTVIGLPWICEDGKRRNCAVTISDQGQILTKYYQLAVDRPEIFTPGENTRKLWFQVKGVHGIVTVGHDRLWSEIAELAAVKGAQLVVNISNDNQDELERDLIWENLGSYRTFTVAVNAAAGSAKKANGQSGMWNSIGYTKKMNAEKIAGTGTKDTILFGEQSVQQTNPWYSDRLKPFESMLSWWGMGAQVIYGRDKEN